MSSSDSKKNWFREQRQRLFPENLSQRQWITVLVLGLLLFSLSITAWFLLRSAFDLNLEHLKESSTWGPLALTAFSFLFLLSCIALISLFLRQAWIARGVLLLVPVSYFFVFPPNGLGLLSAALLVVGFWQFEWNIKAEMVQRVRFSVDRSLHHGLGTAIGLLLIAISLTFYSEFVREGGETTTLRPVTSVASQALNQTLSKQVPGYDANETIDVFLLRLAVRAVAEDLDRQEQPASEETPKFEDLLGPQLVVSQPSGIELVRYLRDLPDDQRELLQRDSASITTVLANNPALADKVARIRLDVLAPAQLTASSDIKVGDLVRELIDREAGKQLTPISHFLPPLYALALFFTLGAFTFLYAILIKLIAGLLVALLKAVHVVRVERVSAEMEIATLV